MPIPSKRTVVADETRVMGSLECSQPIDALTQIQNDAYDRFLQTGLASRERKEAGLEGILREVFPIESYDGQYSLEYVRYELGKPRYTPLECRQLRMTYGRPFRVLLRLNKEQTIEEEVYLGDLPIMLGGGEFIINGAERVVVSQLHRSPGVDFVLASEPGERKSYSCRVIPERGSWIELNVTKKDGLAVRIDQSGKFAATTLLRAMGKEFSTNAQLAGLFYDLKDEAVNDKLVGRVVADDVIFPAGHEQCGEIIIEFGEALTADHIEKIKSAKLKKISMISEVHDSVILHTIRDDVTTSHEEALLRIYQRLRPGNPPALDKAMDLFRDRFFDLNRYRLGTVGRFRINRKFQQDVAEDEMTLNPEDFLNAIRYLIRLRTNDPTAYIDDIDNLGNRRLRTIDELASDEIRKGFLKLRRTVQERMSLKDVEEMTPRTLVNPKSVSAAIEYFFGRSELSQVVDQTNPLSMLTHERRLSALGPGGLNRKRAGFEVRDVHVTHYGRLCTIETPEGPNIGLISSLCVYAKINRLGFIETPYRKVDSGKAVLNNNTGVIYLSAEEEDEQVIAQANAQIDDKGEFQTKIVKTRLEGDFPLTEPDGIHLMDVAPNQIASVAASLIPFLEHDDANRALMGSNMMRQAVPLMIPESPVVGTGIEGKLAEDSRVLATAEGDGQVISVDANEIHIRYKRDEDDESVSFESDVVVYPITKFLKTNQGTCINLKPLVALGQKVKKGDVLVEGYGTEKGELALGRNLKVAFMPWKGYNFEDAIVISERVVREDVYTSIHVNEYVLEVRDTKRGVEELTADIPNVSEEATKDLDENGIIRVGAEISEGDILIGKITPKGETDPSPEEKLLRAIFGDKAGDVKDASLKAPPSTHGVVITKKLFSRAVKDRKIKAADKTLIEALDKEFEIESIQLKNLLVEKLMKMIGGRASQGVSNFYKEEQIKKGIKFTNKALQSIDFLTVNPEGWTKDARLNGLVKKTVHNYNLKYNDLLGKYKRKKFAITVGDELPAGIVKLAKVYVAQKRKLKVGDKMAGRHGNKGIVAKIVRQEDMPFLEDGTPVDIVLNPLGVPSRMNLGQIYETVLGWAGIELGKKFSTPIFDGASLEDINKYTDEAGVPRFGTTYLHDGGTGERFDQPATVGVIYMLKLSHMVDDKMHARSIGPYSLITQQPLGGKAQFGGQRFGEMEVWALEAFGAANILQEILTVKSDDVIGRAKAYECIVKGEPMPVPGIPESFNVLLHELRGLGLSITLD